MKKLITLAVLMVMTAAAQAMSYTQAQREALFLTDKMAYELDLSPEQYEAIYEINFDYFYSVSYRRDIYGNYWSRRDSDLRFVLSPWQYNLYMSTNYFYHPLNWHRGSFRFVIYTRYTDRNHFYRSRPSRYSTYRGGYNRGASRYRGRTFNAPTRPRDSRQRPGVGQTGTFDHGTPSGSRPRTSGTTGTSRPRTSGTTGTSRPRTSGTTGTSRPRTSGTAGTSRPRTSGTTGTSRPRTSGTTRAPHKTGSGGHK